MKKEIAHKFLDLLKDRIQNLEADIELCRSVQRLLLNEVIHK